MVSELLRFNPTENPLDRNIQIVLRDSSVFTTPSRRSFPFLDYIPPSIENPHQKYATYTPVYIGINPLLTELLEPGIEYQPEWLVSRQLRILFPGTVKNIPLDAIRYDHSSDTLKLILSRNFSTEEMAPDTDKGTAVGVENPTVNTLLAFLLAQNKLLSPSGDPITQPNDLSFLESLGLRVDYSMLRNGFANLTSSSLLRHLMGRDFIEAQDLDSIYANSSKWLTEATREIQRKNKKIQYINIYPTEVSAELFPDPLFLPYLGHAFLEYYQSLPERIKQGDIYDLIFFKKSSENLFDISKKVIQGSRGTTSDDILRIVVDEMNKIGADITTLIRHYIENPSLLNRSQGLPLTVGDLVSNYREYRQFVLDAGGRGPRKPTKWRFRQMIKDRQ